MKFWLVPVKQNKLFPGAFWSSVSPSAQCMMVYVETLMATGYSAL